QLHVEVAVERLRRKFGVEVELKAPKVPYKETIKGSAQAQGKHKRQTGGHGQYGDCWIELSPLPRGKGFEFEDDIVGGVIPRQFIPAVEKGIRELLPQGILAGYPIVDVKVRLYDGSAHDVDSSEMAFKIAASLGFKRAFDECKPVLLEPVVTLTVTVPDEFMGDIIGDLNSRRGKVLGAEPKGNGQQVIRAHVPMAEVLRYAPDLRSMTQGRGDFEIELARYEEVPGHIAERIIKEAQAARAETHARATAAWPTAALRDSSGPVALPYGLLSRLHRVRSRVAPALRQVMYGGRPSWTREPNTLPWFDQPDALERVAGADAELLRAWVRDGYVVVDGLVDPADLDAMVATLDGLWGARAAVPHLVLLDLRDAPDAEPRNVAHDEVLTWDGARRARARAASDWRIHGFHYVNAPARPAASPPPPACARSPAACSAGPPVRSPPSIS